VNVVGYVRVALDCSLNEFLDRDAQTESIASWAHDRGHRLVSVFFDEGFDASSDLETRVGFGDALQLMHDGHVQGMVVARLDRLALSVILQEELLAEIERRNGSLFSATPAEVFETTDAISDPTRMLVREVVRDFPLFQSAMRDLWVRKRLQRFKTPDERAAEAFALIRAEQLVHQGLNARAITGILSSEGVWESHVSNFAGLRRLLTDFRRRKKEG
jgi:Resolvase, N terminal domain